MWLRLMKLCIAGGEYFEGMWKYQLETIICSCVQLKCHKKVHLMYIKYPRLSEEKVSLTTGLYSTTSR